MMKATLESVLFTTSTLFLGGLAWIKTKNGDYGKKKLQFENTLTRQYEVLTFYDAKSLFPHKAVIIENDDVPEVLHMRNLHSSSAVDWKSWSAFVHISTVSSLRPFDLKIKKITDEDWYLEILKEEIAALPNAPNSDKAAYNASYRYYTKHPEAI